MSLRRLRSRKSNARFANCQRRFIMRVLSCTLMGREPGSLSGLHSAIGRCDTCAPLSAAIISPASRISVPPSPISLCAHISSRIGAPRTM